MKLQIMNCYEDRIDVDVGNLEDILDISVLVLSGDEVLKVRKKNGDYFEEDSDRHGCMMDFHDAEYTIFNSAFGINKIDEWEKRSDSADWVFRPQ